jgi:hypothetical protein
MYALCTCSSLANLSSNPDTHQNHVIIAWVVFEDSKSLTLDHHL